MEIIKIDTQSSHFKEFVNFGKDIYNTNFTQQKQTETFNFSFFNTGLMLIQNGKILSRLVIYENPNLFYEGKKIITIGNYESVDNQEVAKNMLDEATQIAKSLGGELLLGTMDGSTWDRHRLSLSHDEAPFFLEPYHHLYYNQHFIDNNFFVFASYFSSKDTTLHFDDPSVIAQEKAFLAQGVTIRSIDIANFETELTQLYDFNALAFQQNFLYTPIEKDVFMQKYLPIKNLIDPNFICLAHDKMGNLIGYFFCIQDFYNQKHKSLIIKTIARHPDKKWAGLGHVIGNQIYRRAVAQGFSTIIHAFMYEKGFSTTITKNFFGKPFKNYRLYAKTL